MPTHDPHATTLATHMKALNGSKQRYRGKMLTRNESVFLPPLETMRVQFPLKNFSIILETFIKYYSPPPSGRRNMVELFPYFTRVGQGLSKKRAWGVVSGPA